MAFPSLLTSKPRLRISLLSLSSHFLIHSIPYSSSSSRCRRQPTVPPESPPVAKKVPFTVSAHGKMWQDPYHWMRNTSDPDFVEHLNHENAYAQAFMSDTLHLQRTLFDEMRSRMPTTQISTSPMPWGPWLYYQYIPEGKEYPVMCRMLAMETGGWFKKILSYARGLFGTEQILLDWNEIAEQYGYVHVGSCRISPNQNFLAYTLDTTGGEQFVLQIKDLRNGSIIPRKQVHGVVSLAWTQDGSTLFYTIADENQRPYRVLCTKIGSDEIDNCQVFTEADSSFCVDIASTKDGKFVTVNSNSRTSSEEGITLFSFIKIFLVYVIDATSPLGGLRRIHKRIPDVQCFLEHHYGVFYTLTNAPLSENKKWSCGNFYLARCNVEDTRPSNWQNILPGGNMSFEDMEIFDGHLVLFANKKDNPMLCSIDLPISSNVKGSLRLEDLDPWIFPLPADHCSIAPGPNLSFMSSVYHVVLSSPVMPDMIVDYDMSKRTFSIVQQEEVRGVSSDGGFSTQHSKLCTPEPFELKNNEKHGLHSELWKWNELSDTYCCKRKEVVSHDGVTIPLTILYSRRAWQRGHSPGLLQGYGAYGEVLEKNWCPNRLSLLDRGWVLAFADVRGGNGGDSSWHKSGSGLNKKNSIYDFLSCANYLVDENYVHKERLGAIGFSAGGLLVGAAMNLQPDLFHAAILKVPFLDICNTLLDPSLPLTILDYEEFGNPKIESQFESILSYSPYNHIRSDTCYPAMLVTASFHDSRVGVWEPAKWVARIRDCTCHDCSLSVIMKTNMSGGHFGEGGSYSYCKEAAYDYAFLIKTLGGLNNSK
ncbi:hypothetical protein K2173_016987 [Erythroxylum novogranatense]|uniref:Prolyl endopeptidase n=1 Tax=Erythroxylum novogranatense TaxID=1862640 RepID=A0AAV8U6L2_9ROSI|nr:hypothetical protein K2173_016987 [Erythroxylum novogranatense]